MQRVIGGSKTSALPLIIAVIVFMFVVGLGYFIYSTLTASSNKTSTSISQSTTAKNNNPYAVLKPATVTSKIAECTEQLSYASNGDPSPIQCPNGNLNILDWQAIAALEPTVMRLGYYPSAAQVQSAICADGNVADADSSASISAPLENNAYMISALYYGWHFSINPIALLDNGGC